jgi:hypothetical protein
MKSRPAEQFVQGYRPVVHAREGLMLGIRQPLDGPVFETELEAERWCIHVMASHYNRRLGMSEARIYCVQGSAACLPEPPSSSTTP